ncbi:BlaI/MecI/CopY family transcriptional regulator [Clostridium nigeriense]|uniref:BlaI/MecI/CopY family transcriptional regulator n=1 Tax=Clostridium nigeriense TaxID=1805470 RepID=UPI003D3378C9
MYKLPKISDAEWEVMKIIWSKKEITANEIIDSLNGKQEWKNTTIKSLINRLLKKEAIGFRKNGKEYFYYPLISEEECIKEESQSFLKKVFNGSLNEMLLNLVKSEKLTKDDINELREMLNNKLDMEDKK